MEEEMTMETVTAYPSPTPLCQHQVRRSKAGRNAGESPTRHCFLPVVAGEIYCAKHGGKHKTKRVPLYKRWITASVMRLAKMLGKR